ncbi:hypothetical protein OH491_23555 [Termitidicoccus mucosus]|uniref:Uncharacterized protein n=1 Tax=Termitidicoccus mucosus TaxID=1184151 RepID=A0A178IQE8_9BACT|nr:hypothetical protein AW736_02920 [Opitutaceae bacterium TSB47]
MKLSDRMKKFEGEIRALADKLKDDTAHEKTFLRKLIKDMRQTGFIALPDWRQNGYATDILAWKYGVAVAIRLRGAGMDYIMPQLDDLMAVRHENEPERPVLRILIGDLPPDETETALLAARQVINLLPGDLNLALPAPPSRQNRTTPDLGDNETPF